MDFGNRLVSYGSSERKPLLVFTVVVIFFLMLLFCDTRMKKPRTSRLLIFFPQPSACSCSSVTLSVSPAVPCYLVLPGRFCLQHH